MKRIGSTVIALLLIISCFSPASLVKAVSGLDRSFTAENLSLLGTAEMDFPEYLEKAPHPAAHAIDGKEDTYAQCEGYNQWSLTVDLKNTHEINQIRLLTGNANRATKYTLETSLDGTEWNTVATEMSAKPGSEGYNEYSFALTEARYVRMHVTDSICQTMGDGSQDGHSLKEFQIMGNPEPKDKTSLTDLTFLGSATMDYPEYGGHPAVHAIDGDEGTYAQSLNYEPWSLTVDLKGEHEVGQIKLLTGNANRATKYTLETSLDGTEWNTVATETSAKPGSEGYNEYSFALTKARYVRMHVTDSICQIMGDGSQAGHSLKEFRILGKINPEGITPSGPVTEEQLGTLLDSDGFTAEGCSSQSGTSAGNVLDKNEESVWQPGDTEDTHDLIIDTQNAHDFTGIKIVSNTDNLGLYYVFTSEDGIRWYKEMMVYQVKPEQRLLLPQDNRRYVRLRFMQESHALKVAEIYLYGSKTILPEVPEVQESEIWSRSVIAPMPNNVEGTETPVVSLNGEWNFVLYPDQGYWQEGENREKWTTVTLPGDAETQGYIRYTISDNDSQTQYESAFEKTITIPAEFAEKRVILRLNGVVNYGRLWVDGELVRTHRSGKTTWDTDITDYVTPGQEARITIGVTCENPKVDFQRIRGITGDISLMALPQNYLSRFHVETDFDDNYQNAELTIQAGMLFHNRTSGTVQFSLTDSNGSEVILQNNTLEFESTTEDPVEKTLTNHIDTPQKWDAEHPNLYTLTATVFQDGIETERIEKKIGFREIQVEGSTVYVNGDPIKLRGVNYSDHRPDLGVATDKEYQKKILENLKKANVNYIRTAHCPQSDYFYSLCDELGFYVESEASIFFIGMNSTQASSLSSDPDYKDAYLNAVSEMVEEHKSHPSILYWSLGNESVWGSNNDLCYDYVKEADPTRPTKFSWGYNAPAGKYEIYSSHYDYPSKSPTGAPIIVDEYAHGYQGKDEIIMG